MGARARAGQVLGVVTEHGLITVPLVARRAPPNLNLPAVIAVGNCLVSARRVGDAEPEKL